jgi:hypothetical protein
VVGAGVEVVVGAGVEVVVGAGVEVVVNVGKKDGVSANVGDGIGARIEVETGEEGAVAEFGAAGLGGGVLTGTKVSFGMIDTAGVNSPG